PDKHPTTSPNYRTYAADLSVRSETEALIDTLKADHERIDVLINNAGHALRAPSVDYPMDDWDRLIELNLTAPFLLSRGLAPPMLQRGAGKVIFTASLWSFLGGRSVPAYTVTKSGIAGMIRALSNEWAPQGVQVNGIAPGYIDTDLTRPAINDPEIGPAFLSRIPAGRWGEPRDVAGAALFLASHHSDYITGTIVPVDGGWLAH
ncbi:MAG: SDR family oxidoreductase, partial [Candidatus Nanopelagicales bacterium]|nr:SDR family oxidoreductase [Candidatus Nanopelagicales bacterium]